MGGLEEEEEERAHGALQHAGTHGGHLLAAGFGGWLRTAATSAGMNNFGEHSRALLVEDTP